MEYHVCRAAFISDFIREEVERVHIFEKRIMRPLVGYELAKIKMLPDNISQKVQDQINDFIKSIQHKYKENINDDEYNPLDRQHAMDWEINLRKPYRRKEKKELVDALED